MTFLLDVNVLVTLHAPRHPHYKLVSSWFKHRVNIQFGTCPITQSGLLRLLVQGLPGVAPFQIDEAREALEHLIQRPGHIFWPDTPPYLDAADRLFKRIQGHRQITDAYLLGLAIRNSGKLATLDGGIRHLAGSEFAANVELIQ
ncbi:MAG: TA system VapC family ribonuclease toxin [Terracidiphilus sp.]